MSIDKSCDYNTIFSTDTGERPSQLDDNAKGYRIAKGSQDYQHVNCDFSPKSTTEVKINKVLLEGLPH